MSNILSYPLIPVVSGEDLLIISDTSVKGNPTRSVRVDQIVSGGGGGGGVLMVDASINGNAVSITGGPITISGILDFRFGGLSTQYVNGLGNLVTFPTISNPYVLPLASNGTRGGVQIGYTEAGQNYPVELSNEKMFVNVPWTNTNTNTTYDLTSIQNVNDVYVHLTGSDATVDTIQLVAGANITLTDDGLNNITIDATSGSSGTVESVGLSHTGNAFVVTPASTPVTSIGTLAVTMSGTNLEYINGAGDRIPLSTLPSGSVTSVASGPGITATPSPITGAGSIEVDYLGLDNVILSGGPLITDAVSGDYILLSEAKNNNCAHSLISDLPGYYTNFLGSTLTMVKAGVGHYILSTSGGNGDFGSNVIAFIENPNEYGVAADVFPQVTTIRRKSATEIAVRSFNVGTGTAIGAAGDLLSAFEVCAEIRVYP